MTKDEKLIMAKAWCFDNCVSLKDIEEAWNNAIEKNCYVITSLAKNGLEWWWLGDNAILLSQLMERYGKRGANE